MPIYKYTVANQKGKKLSGSVEAPDEQTARNELNNLGFSILHLEETTDMPQVDKNLKRFIFESVDKNGKLVSGTIPAKDSADALQKLQTQYALTVSAIWPEGATPEEIAQAKQQGPQAAAANDQQKKQEQAQEKTLEQQKEEAFTKAKIDNILKEVNLLLQKFDADFSIEQKALINKKINKILRIKNSTNFQYILKTAEELLQLIRDQEKTLQEKGYQDKKIELEIETKKMLDELKSSGKPKSLKEDILLKIETWQAQQQNKDPEKITTKFLGKALEKLKAYFQTPPQIQVIKDQIKAYNKQLIDFAKLYFKEPTKEYKAKVVNSLKTIYKARKTAKHSLKQAKILLKKRHLTDISDIRQPALTKSLLHEVNSLSGWLVTFYLIYYFVALYLTTKDFGLTNIPKGFSVYESHFFKYVIVILFLLHISTALKIEFFKKSLAANIILPLVFSLTSILVLLNF